MDDTARDAISRHAKNQLARHQKRHLASRAIHFVQIGDLGKYDPDVDRPNAGLLSSYCRGPPARCSSEELDAVTVELKCP